MQVFKYHDRIGTGIALGLGKKFGIGLDFTRIQPPTGFRKFSVSMYVGNRYFEFGSRKV